MPGTAVCSKPKFPVADGHTIARRSIGMYAKAIQARSPRGNSEDSLGTMLAGRRPLYCLLGGIMLAFISLNAQADNAKAKTFRGWSRLP